MYFVSKKHGTATATDLKVCELVDECPNHWSKYGDRGWLHDPVNRREEEGARPDADHVEPNRELPHPLICLPHKNEMMILSYCVRIESIISNSIHAWLGWSEFWINQWATLLSVRCCWKVKFWNKNEKKGNGTRLNIGAEAEQQPGDSEERF